MNIMKKHFLVSLGIMGVVILAVCVVILLHKYLGDNANVIADTSAMLSAITGLCTMVIAILAYRSYFIDNRIVDKNLDAVIKVIEEYQKMSFWIKGKNYVLIIRLNDRDFVSRYGDYSRRKLCFTKSAFTTLCDFVAFSKSPFLPQKIAKAIDMVTPCFGRSVDNPKGYAVVGILGRKQDAEVVLYNDKELTVEEFINMLNSVRLTILEWLSANAKNVDIIF